MGTKQEIHHYSKTVIPPSGKRRGKIVFIIECKELSMDESHEIDINIVNCLLGIPGLTQSETALINNLVEKV